MRSSSDGCLMCVGETLFELVCVDVLLLSWSSARGTDWPMVASWVAEVSMVMVGARGRRGPSLSGADMAAGVGVSVGVGGARSARMKRRNVR